MKYILMFVFLFSFLLSAQDFTTRFEKSNFLQTSRYDETINWFKALDAKSDLAKLLSLGKSPQNRDIYCMVVSKDKAFTAAEARRVNKPVVIILNGIHSGEIEGKDASMILLREMLITKEKQSLLENVTLLVIPIFSVDGHERFRAFNRINQNGPEEMGWRTTSHNINLNRDWLKADAPEMQSLLKFYSEWLPDFLVDNHTTDGADFQYSLTYGIERYQNVQDNLRSFIQNDFVPYFLNSVESKGFLIAPYVGFTNDGVEKGIYDWAGSPRLSGGYTAAQNRLGLLVETHMMKPYKERVFATKAATEAVLEFCNKNASAILKVNKEADQRSIHDLTRNSYLPVNFKTLETNPSKYVWKGIKFRKEQSEISGKEKLVYIGEKYEIEVPFFNNITVVDSVKAPKGYYIPVQFKEIVERLKFHGIKVETVEKDKEVEVVKTKFSNPKYAARPYEGRHTVQYSMNTFKVKEKITKGSFYVPVDQRTIRIILFLLEPGSQESFISWGFFNGIFEQKEYFEDYVMEKVALEMIKKDPDLKAQFDKKLTDDEEFRNNAYARLNFFYQRSPYYDENFMVYPIMKVE